MIFDKLFGKQKGKNVDARAPLQNSFEEGVKAYNACSYSQAMEYFQAVVGAQPDNVEAYLYLADSYHNLGKDANAESAIKKILALDPGNRKAQDFLNRLQTRFAPHVTKTDTNTGFEFDLDDEFERVLRRAKSHYSDEPDPQFALQPTPHPASSFPLDPYDPHLDIRDFQQPTSDLLTVGKGVNVSLKGLIDTNEFQNSQAALPIALGCNDDGSPYIADLTQMPHLLVSSMNGYGRTTCLNCMLVSLMTKKHPSEVKFVIMGDQSLMLSTWDRLEKHYLTKEEESSSAVLCKDSKAIIRTLYSLCIEMDNRYELLRGAGVRSIADFNNVFVQRHLNPLQKVSPGNFYHYLPYITVFCFEFAEIMKMSNEVEPLICRLAQLAKPVGIHLVLSTNNPSADVFSTKLKAEFPARISFKVARGIESNAILGVNGAQNLTKPGEMLYVPSNGAIPIHLIGSYVSEEDIDKITYFVGGQRGYLDVCLLPPYWDSSCTPNGLTFNPKDKDEFFNDAARLVVQSQFGSASLLQRKLGLGYNRAGQVMDQLEAAGIVGPHKGSKPREVLIQDEEILERMLRRL